MTQTSTGGLTAGPRAWRVLVVDDEENLNWSLVTSLRRENYAADGALTADDARRRMADASYDCVISDIQMPGMDGFQLLTWLREQRPQPRVIMMTAFGSPSARQEAFRNGVVAFMEKPFDLATLKHELRKALDTTAQGIGYDLLEITQVISLGRQDVAVQVRLAEQVGQLVFERGELVSAVYGGLRGEQAFFAMCASPAQMAAPAPIPPQFERNISQPVSALIFDALLKRDAGLASASASPRISAPSSDQSSGALYEPTAPPSQPTITGSLTPAARMTGGMAAAQPARDAQAALAALVSAIARPCAAALVSPDGAIRAQAQTRVPPLPETAFRHLAQGFISFARAAHSGQLGAPRAARMLASGEQALIRLVGP
ncbi:MAG TPA: response regulator, partial [Ktedonobacterales bacterium]